MLIVYDPPKRIKKLNKHNLDFASLSVEFFEAAAIFPATGNGGAFDCVNARRQQKGKEPLVTKFSSKRPLTDAEEAEVQRLIASDPDNPEVTDEQIKSRKTFAEAFPDLAESIKRGPGRPRLDNAKEAVTLRVDPATVARFKALGDNWRTIMADVLEHADNK